MISVKNSEEKMSVFRFHGNDGHLGCYGTRQGTRNFKIGSSNALHSWTHIEDINMKKFTLVLFTIFCVKNTHTLIDQKSAYK